MIGLLYLVMCCGFWVEVLEIGLSVGLNLLIDWYCFDLGGVMVGLFDLLLMIWFEWCGVMLFEVLFVIELVCGVDI